MLSLPPSKAAHCQVRKLMVNEVTPAFVSAWADLESRAVEPNAYLSPHFILPAIRHLDPEAHVWIIAVETGALGGHELIGIGIFQPVLGTRPLPLPHLVAYKSRHSYLGGLLLDRERARAALDALFNYVKTLGWCQGVMFGKMRQDGPVDRLLTDVATQRGIEHDSLQPTTRAMLELGTSHADLGAILGTRQAKDLRRRRRRLDELGTVRWTLHREGGVPERAIDTFLALEHQGWKGETHSSLRSRRADETFFREAVARFSAEERVFFTELSLEGEVIASTSNFVSGQAGFAFKLGWRESYAKMSPGILNELEFVRRFPHEVCCDLRYLDSGSVEGSFMERVWPERAAFHTFICSMYLGGPVLVATRVAREIKRVAVAHVRSRLVSRPD